MNSVKFMMEVFQSLLYVIYCDGMNGRVENLTQKFGDLYGCTEIDLSVPLSHDPKGRSQYFIRQALPVFSSTVMVSQPAAYV
jgi:hypothetical protein